MRFATVLAFTCLFAAPAVASPMYPWYYPECAPVLQDDGKIIGAVCSDADGSLQVEVIHIWYFGYLFENEGDFVGFYANLAIDGGPFTRTSLKKVEVGDDRNLPKRTVLHGRYIATDNFNRDFPKGKPFQIYYQAEEKKPVHNPPFSCDNLFEKNYRGELRPVLY